MLGVTRVSAFLITPQLPPPSTVHSKYDKVGFSWGRTIFPIPSTARFLTNHISTVQQFTSLPHPMLRICHPTTTGSTALRRATSTTTRTRTLPLYSIINSAAMVIDQLVQSSPYATAAITCGIKASTADYIAQRRQLRKRNDSSNNQGNNQGTNTEYNYNSTTPTTSSLFTSRSSDEDVTPNDNATIINTKPSKNVVTTTDYSRNIAFLLYGAFYQGMGQEYIYNHLYPHYFGTGTNIYTVLIKVAFDLFIQTTMVTLPVAYCIKAMIYKYSFKEALRRYVDDIKNHGLLIKYFTLWGPVQCLTFSIVPEHYRIMFIAVVSFFWLIILSSISSRVRNTTTVMNNTKVSTTIPDRDSNNSLVDVKTNTILSLVPSQECELVDGLTCNIDG